MKLSDEEPVRELCVPSLYTMALLPLSSLSELTIERIVRISPRRATSNVSSAELQIFKLNKRNSRKVGCPGGVPSRGRREAIVRIDEGFESLSQYLFLNGKHKILIGMLNAPGNNMSASVHTEAFATKLVRWTSSPEWASINASYHVPLLGFCICTECARTRDPSSLAIYWMEGGNSLCVPSSAPSAIEMALSKEREGVGGATFSYNVRQNHLTRSRK